MINNQSVRVVYDNETVRSFVASSISFDPINKILTLKDTVKGSESVTTINFNNVRSFTSHTMIN